MRNNFRIEKRCLFCGQIASHRGTGVGRHVELIHMHGKCLTDEKTWSSVPVFRLASRVKAFRGHLFLLHSHCEDVAYQPSPRPTLVREERFQLLEKWFCPEKTEKASSSGCRVVGNGKLRCSHDARTGRGCGFLDSSCTTGGSTGLTRKEAVSSQ